jgi:hypothetical protein
VSSALRTLQKRILKRAGYKRERQAIRILSGKPVTVKLGKGEGEIVNRSGDSLGKRWPFTIPAIGTVKRATVMRCRGSRRGKRNATWLAEAAEARA